MTNTIKECKQLPSSVVEEYGKMVSTICRRMLQNNEIANDAAQEVWLEVVKAYSRFDNRSKISTWIYTITHRVVMRYASHEQLYSTRFLKSYFHGETHQSSVVIDYDHTLWVKEMCNKCLTGILHCLDNQARIAYIFRDVAGLTYPEIAVVLEKEELTIRQILSRSRRKLKNFLNDECLLYNQNGSCRCRMRKMALKVNLPSEYEKIRTSIKQINFFRNSEQVMPGQDYWEKYL
jgi:RNA polymerase sigma factor (sigma-70 family)